MAMITSVGEWKDFVTTVVDRKIDWANRSQPLFRQVIDKHPEQQAMPGKAVTIFMHKDLPVTTTPLAEDVDSNEILMDTPDKVTVILKEYGVSTRLTNFLKLTAFSQPQSDRIVQLANHQADTIDKIVQNVMDTTTNAKETIAAGAFQALAGAGAQTALSLKHISAITAKMRRDVVTPLDGTNYVAFISPETQFDLMTETGDYSWNAPHTKVDTAEFYAGVVGRLGGVSFIASPRCGETAAGNGEYVSYFFGKQALVEATAEEPHSVVGTVVDNFNRFYPLSWYGVLGHGLYRPESMWRVVSKTGAPSLA